ncbi:MAG: sodium:calcium antiporter [Longimicrobiales bacterium]|nr:sodium:calcium antiporter [Longimicrobiales bacterium]
MTTTLLLYGGVLVVGSAATWFGSVRLERAAGYLSRHYRLPALVQGTLVVAVASSLPELSTVVVSALVHGDFELGMASIVGSAIFNILVIPGISSLVGDGGLRAQLRLVYRDAQFYLTAVAVLLLTFSFAIIYEPVEGETLTGVLTRLPAAVPLLLYVLYLFLQQQEVADSRNHEAAEAVDGSSGIETPSASDAFQGPLRAWIDLVLGVVLIIGGVEGLLRVAIGLGDLLATPSFLWGATVVAAATSVPDAIISFRSADRDEGDISIGNVLGSNLFDLLVAIPAGILVTGAAVIDYRVAAPLMGFLTLATVVLFTVLRTDLALERLEGWILLALYLTFVLWLGLETAGVTTVLGAVVTG